MFWKLGLGDPNPTTMRILIADHSIKKITGFLYDVHVKMDQFIFTIDLVILDYEIDHEVPIILHRLIFVVDQALLDMDYGEIKFWVSNKEV